MILEAESEVAEAIAGHASVHLERTSSIDNRSNNYLRNVSLAIANTDEDVVNVDGLLTRTTKKIAKPL